MACYRAKAPLTKVRIVLVAAVVASAIAWHQTQFTLSFYQEILLARVTSSMSNHGKMVDMGLAGDDSALVPAAIVVGADQWQ